MLFETKAVSRFVPENYWGNLTSTLFPRPMSNPWRCLRGSEGGLARMHLPYGEAKKPPPGGRLISVPEDTASNFKALMLQAGGRGMPPPLHSWMVLHVVLTGLSREDFPAERLFLL